MGGSANLFEISTEDVMKMSSVRKSSETGNF